MIDELGAASSNDEREMLRVLIRIESQYVAWSGKKCGSCSVTLFWFQPGRRAEKTGIFPYKRCRFNGLR